MYCRDFNVFGPTPPFLLKEITLKIYFFRVFFYLLNKLCTNFQKICSWAEQDISMPNLLQTLRLFLVALFSFCFKKLAWKSKFSEIFYLLNRQWLLLSWKRVRYRLYAAQQGVIIPIYLRLSDFLCCTSPFLP